MPTDDESRLARTHWSDSFSHLCAALLQVERFMFLAHLGSKLDCWQFKPVWFDMLLLLLRLIIINKSAWLILHGGAEVCKSGRGPRGGHHVGQLLPALLLPGSVGWQQGVCFCLSPDPASCSALHNLYH